MLGLDGPDFPFMNGFGSSHETDHSVPPQFASFTPIIETAIPTAFSIEVTSETTLEYVQSNQVITTQSIQSTQVTSAQSIHSTQAATAEPEQSIQITTSQSIQSSHITTQYSSFVQSVHSVIVPSVASSQVSSLLSSTRASQGIISQNTQQKSSIVTPCASTFQTTFHATSTYSSSDRWTTSPSNSPSISPVTLHSSSLFLPGTSHIQSSIPGNFKSSSIQQSTTSLPSSFSTSSTSSTTATSTATPIGTLAGDSASQKSKASSTRTGAIVGGSVSGAACIAVLLFALLVFFRRRGQPPNHKRQVSLQKLLRRESMTSILSFHDRSFGSHDRKPSLPIRSLSDEIPSAPFFSTQRRPHPANIHMHPALSPSISLERITPLSPLRADIYGFSTNTSVDALRDPPSPVINISPPSRTASIYSCHSSWEEAILDHYETPSLSPLSTPHHPSQGTLNIPGFSFEGSQYLGTPPMDDSRHSNPFDLEPPPHALRKGEPLLPHPLSQGDAF